MEPSHVISKTHAKIPHSSYAPQPFDQMPHRKQQDSECTPLWDAFNIIQYVTKHPTIPNAATTHALAVKQGSLTDLCTTTSLLTTYSRCKNFKSSSAFFDEVLDIDVVSWNAMMSSRAQKNCFEAAIGVFKKMVEKGNKFDLTSVVIVISAFSNLKRLEQGRVAHCLSIKAGMLSDRVLSNATIDMNAKCGNLASSECVFEGVECKDLATWNSIITGSIFNNHPEKLLWYFGQMISCENEADSISISCALSACTCLQEFDVGQAIHGWATKSGYAVNSYISVANSLVSYYSQLREIYAAESV